MHSLRVFSSDQRAWGGGHVGGSLQFMSCVTYVHLHKRRRLRVAGGSNGSRGEIQ